MDVCTTLWQRGTPTEKGSEPLTKLKNIEKYHLTLI